MINWQKLPYSPRANLNESEKNLFNLLWATQMITAYLIAGLVGIRLTTFKSGVQITVTPFRFIFNARKLKNPIFSVLLEMLI